MYVRMYVCKCGGPTIQKSEGRVDRGNVCVWMVESGPHLLCGTVAQEFKKTCRRPRNSPTEKRMPGYANGSLGLAGARPRHSLVLTPTRPRIVYTTTTITTTTTQSHSTRCVQSCFTSTFHASCKFTLCCL